MMNDVVINNIVYHHHHITYDNAARKALTVHFDEGMGANYIVISILIKRFSYHFHHNSARNGNRKGRKGFDLV